MSELAKNIIEEVCLMTEKLPEENEALQESMGDVEKAVDELIGRTADERVRELESDLAGWKARAEAGEVARGELVDALKCDRCGHGYLTAWIAPDHIWHIVTGRGNDGLICPSCFDEMARGIGIVLVWSVNDEPKEDKNHILQKHEKGGGG